MTTPGTSTKDTNPKDAIGCKKPPLSVIPMPVLFEVGAGMLEGSCKYRRHNYREVGVRASIYFDATMRHLALWWEGEDIDLDSGLSHITKAIASLIVLRDAQMRHMVNDDRPPQFDNDPSRIKWMEQMQDKVDNVLAKYPDPLPPYTQKGIDNEEEADKVTDFTLGRNTLATVEVGIEEETEGTVVVRSLNIGDIFSTADGTFKVSRCTPETDLVFAAMRLPDGSYDELHQRRPDGSVNNREWYFEGSDLVAFKGEGK